MKKITNKYVYLLTAVISLNISIFINANDSAPIIQPGAPGKSSKEKHKKKEKKKRG